MLLMDEEKSLCVSMGVVKKALSAANSCLVLWNVFLKLAWDLPRIVVIWDQDSEHCMLVLLRFYYFPLNLSNYLNNTHSRVQDSVQNKQPWQEWLLPDRTLPAVCLSGCTFVPASPSVPWKESHCAISGQCHRLTCVYYAWRKAATASTAIFLL